MRGPVYGSLIVIILSTVLSGAQRWRVAAALDDFHGGDNVLVMTSAEGDSAITARYRFPVPRFSTDSLQSKNGRSIQRCAMGNCVRNPIEGEPILPSVPSRILLPFGYTVKDIIVVEAEKRPIPGTFFLEYGPAYIPLVPDAKKREAVPKSEIYNSDNPYPGKPCILHSIQKQRGLSSAFLTINPVVYYPASGTVAWYKELTCRVLLEKAKPAENDLKVRLDGIQSRDYDNPEMLSTYRNGALSGTRQIGPCSPRDYRYVVVTNNTLKSAQTTPSLTDLLVHRAKAFTDTIVTVEEIYAKYTGKDNAEKVRTFIRDAYNSWKTDFVLLGGDIAVVPFRGIYGVILGPNLLPEFHQIPSDAYFQCLDGSYNSNNNNNWGEPTDGEGGEQVDLSPDIHVGRIPAENADEMANSVYKIIRYETAEAGSVYLKSALMAGEKLGFSGISEYAKPFMEQIRLGGTCDGYTTAGFASCGGMTVKTLYEDEGDWDSANGKDIIIGKINADNIGYLNHLGHSNNEKSLHITIGEESGFTNTNPLFFYSQGCVAGNFEKDCIGEHFTTQNRHGMFGAVMNSRYGLGAQNSTDAPSQKLNRQFWDAYFGENMWYTGEMFSDQRQDNIAFVGATVMDGIRWVFFCSNLLCDPAVALRAKGDPLHLALTSPNGGETLIQSSLVPISWNFNGNGDIAITLLKADTLFMLIENAVPNNGHLQWKIPDSLPDGADYRIRIKSADNAAIVDESDQCFIINREPTFTSKPVTTAQAKVEYSYTVTADDHGDVTHLTFDAPLLPSWLSLTDNSNGTATLQGTPLPSDSGQHPVTLSVADGIIVNPVNQTFTVTVKYFAAPVVTGNPLDVVVNKGKTATFSINATGAQLSFQWQKNKIGIPGMASHIYKTQPLDISDNGAFFRCIVSNPGGSDTSNAAKLTVLPVTAIVTTDNVQPGTAGFYAAPNPAHENSDAIVFCFRADGISEARLTVFDAVGNRIWQTAACTNRILWNLKNTLGKRIAAGTYAAVLVLAYTDGTLQQTILSVGLQGN